VIAGHIVIQSRGYIAKGSSMYPLGKYPLAPSVWRVPSGEFHQGVWESRGPVWFRKRGWWTGLCQKFMFFSPLSIFSLILLVTTRLKMSYYMQVIWWYCKINTWLKTKIVFLEDIMEHLVLLFLCQDHLRCLDMSLLNLGVYLGGWWYSGRWPPWTSPSSLHPSHSPQDNHWTSRATKEMG